MANRTDQFDLDTDYNKTEELDEDFANQGIKGGSDTSGSDMEDSDLSD